MTTPTPARVSGPGQLSQRTDNGQPLRALPDAKYGENKQLMDQQRAAPLADGPERPAGLGSPVAAGVPSPALPGMPPNQDESVPDLTPLSAPTARPGEHVTTGAQYGSSRPPAPTFRPGQLSEALRPYAAADDTGILAGFMWELAGMGL